MPYEGQLQNKEALNTSLEIMGVGALFRYHGQMNALGRLRGERAANDELQPVPEQCVSGVQGLWTGKLVRLRAPEPGDWGGFRDEVADAELERLGGRWISPPRSDEWWRNQAGERAKATPADGHLNLVIETLAGEFAGAISSRDVRNEDGAFSYGINVLPRFHGSGMAAEALAILIRFYFEERRFQKVNGEVWSFNERSIAFHRKFGFIEEGRIRRDHYSGGEYHDMVVFGMTCEEFFERYGRRAVRSGE